MADLIRGTIQYVPEPRQFRKGNNVTTYYSIKVNDTYYSVGNKAPPAEGTLVEFEAEKNAKGYWDVTKGGLRVITAEAPTQSVAQGAVSAAQTAVMPREDYWRRKDDRDIEWQKHQKDVVQPRIDLSGCRNTAIEMVKLLITPIATAEGPVAIVKLPAKAKQVEFVEKLVSQYTEQFVAENNKKNEKNEETVKSEESPVQSAGPVDKPDDQAGWDA